MKITKGFYTSDCSDLLVQVLKVSFEHKDYYKCKVIFANKHNGIFYSQENVKLYKDKITNWRRVNKSNGLK